ncbi:MAG: insulinase family protein [Oscillospiraceae bacterium]|jgi:predicted Zn-dependent peptidase|nr:insulinase family protein [Oscillospiraceae bacterium]
MNVTRYKAVKETLYEEVLPNGLTVRVVPRPQFRRSFAVFATDYGGADQRFSLGDTWIDTPAGIAHYLEHKMFDTADGNALNILAASGAQPNAFTSSDITAYYFECTERFQTNLEQLLSFVSVPYFTEESVEKERGIIGQEIGMVEDSPGFQVYIRLMRALYRHSPVNSSVAGTVESIAKITVQDLYNCHKAFYTPSNMALAVVGNVDPEAVLDTARRLLPAEKAPKPVVDYGEDEPELPKERYTELHMEVSAPQFMIGAKVRPERSGQAHLRQKHVGNLSMAALFGRASRFYTTLYSKNLLSGFEYDFDYAANAATLCLAGESANPQAVLEQVISAADEVRRNGLDKEKFQRVKNAALGNLIFSLEDMDDLAVSLAQSSFYDYNTLDAHRPEADVTMEECEAFITEHFTPERLAMSVVSPGGK